MAVNLTGLDLSGTTAGSAHKTSSTSNTAARTTQDEAQQPREEVSVSSSAALLSRLQKSLATQPAVDQGRVADISKAIASGTYQVNPDRIAQGLMRSERDLGKLR